MKSKCLIRSTTDHLDEVEALADDIKLIGQDPFYQHVLERTSNGLIPIIKTKKSQVAYDLTWDLLYYLLCKYDVGSTAY